MSDEKSSELFDILLRIAGKFVCTIKMNINLIPPKDMIIFRKVLKFQEITSLHKNYTGLKLPDSDGNFIQYFY